MASIMTTKHRLTAFCSDPSKLLGWLYFSQHLYLFGLSKAKASYPPRLYSGDGAWMDIVPNDARLVGAKKFAILAAD